MKREVNRPRRGVLAMTVVATALLGVTRVHAEDSVEVPNVIFSKSLEGRPPVPGWVSADAAMTPSREIDEHLFYPHWVDTLRTMHGLTAERASPERSGVKLLEEDECPAVVSILNSRIDKPRDRGLLNLLRDAKAVLVGSSGASTPGFYYGSGASLLTVELTEVIRQPDQKAVLLPKHIHLGYRTARFSIEGIPVCTDSVDSNRPIVVGSRLLLFSELAFVDDGSSLLDFRYQELVLENEEGGLALPPNLLADDEMVGVGSFDDLIAKVKVGRHLIGLAADVAEGESR